MVRRLRRLRVRGLLLLTALAFLVPSCGERAPRYSLRMVMLEIDRHDRELRTGLKDPTRAVAELAEHGRQIETWMGDPGFARFANGPTMPGGDGALADFEARRASFGVLLGDMLTTAGGGDRDATLQSYRVMRAACEDCHAAFRPLGALPIPQ